MTSQRTSAYTGLRVRVLGELLNAEVHTTQELNLLVILPDLSCVSLSCFSMYFSNFNLRSRYYIFLQYSSGPEED